MTKRYRPTRLRLINWHNFIDETIAMDGSIFLIGDNGSGKTTILDAVHCALTGNLKVELNAAARVGGRREEGRTLKGVVLRYDVEQGFRRADGAVAYAALELAREDDDERRLCLGVGVYVAHADARPELWGFMAPGPLAEIDLVDGDRRPRDKAELAAVLPAGAVTDIGRYRTRVGERLFGSRDNLEQVASFLRAGKAYRELVTKTSNFSELFASLLPAPDVETFHEVRRALEAIERTRTDLKGLDDELTRLRTLIDWRDKVAQETEAIARYDFLEAHHVLAAAEERAARADGAAASAAREHEAARGEQRALEDRLASEETELQSLRASRGAELLQRRQELAHRLSREAERADACARRREDAERSLEGSSRALDDAAGLAAAAASHAAQTCAELVRAGAIALSDHELEGLHSLGRRFETLSRDPRAATFDVGAADEERRSARRAVAAHAAERRREEQLARGRAEAAAADAEGHEERAAELRSRGEVGPPIAALDAAVALLARHGVEAVPLYRLLEPADSLSPAEAGLLERTLGPRRLGTLVTAPADHEKALGVLLEHAPGVPLAEPAEETVSTGRPPDGDRRRSAVTAFLRVVGGRATAAAYLEHHLARVRFVRRPLDDDMPFLTRKGHLHAGRVDERLIEGPPVWLGAAFRRKALEAELVRLDGLSTAARDRARDEGRLAASRREEAERLERASARADEVDVARLAERLGIRDRAAAEVGRADAELTERRREHEQAVGEHRHLAQGLETVEAAVRERGLDVLAKRITELEATWRRGRDDLARLAERVGGLRERSAACAREEAVARAEVRGHDDRLREVRSRLLGLVPPEHRADLDDYVLRTRRGRGVKPENVPQHRLESERRRERLVTLLSEGDGVRHPLLWQKYAFRYDRDRNHLADNAGRDLDDVADDLQRQVDELDRALRGRNEDLLERIVMEQLVTALRREVGQLESTVMGVNTLTADLQFGRNRYRIEASLKKEMRRLHELLRSAGGMHPAAKADLERYFKSRLDEFEEAGPDGLPPLLDHRTWYDFHLRMSTMDDGGVVLSRERLRQGSGGEQAVPSYLLLLCLTTLLYDGIDARVRLLLLDEAFYGIDLGRRDELLRFCDRAGITLVVATPEMDGVSEALAASTTVLIEKTESHDVFLWDARYERRERNLFDDGRPGEESLRIGRRTEPREHGSGAGA